MASCGLHDGPLNKLPLGVQATFIILSSAVSLLLLGSLRNLSRRSPFFATRRQRRDWKPQPRNLHQAKTALVIGVVILILQTLPSVLTGFVLKAYIQCIEYKYGWVKDLENNWWFCVPVIFFNVSGAFYTSDLARDLIRSKKIVSENRQRSLRFGGIPRTQNVTWITDIEMQPIEGAHPPPPAYALRETVDAPPPYQEYDYENERHDWIRLFGYRVHEELPGYESPTHGLPSNSTRQFREEFDLHLQRLARVPLGSRIQFAHSTPTPPATAHLQ